MYSIIQYISTLIWRQCYCDKKLDLGWWPPLLDANFPTVCSNVGYQLPHFLQATRVTPSPSLPPTSPPNQSTQVTQFI
jgi:hypothetical protein